MDYGLEPWPGWVEPGSVAYVYTFKHRKVKERGSNVAWRKEEKKKSLGYVAKKKHKENNRSLCTDK